MGADCRARIMREEARTRFARRLRRDVTDAERKLWHHLRRRQLLGDRFRRQFPIGPYIVDFACLETKLIIEVDGSQHFDAASDVARTSGCMNMAFKCCGSGSHPDLPPQAGEGDKS